jgi:hypothetical protein
MPIMMKTTFYYSFAVGLAVNGEKSFKFDDLKLPAFNPIQACFMRQILCEFDLYAKKGRSKEKVFKYVKDKLFINIRKVYEYEVVERKGKTVLRFRLVQAYNMSETLFRDYGY